MTTVVNTPGGDRSDSGLGLIIGVIIAIALIVLFIFYGLPALRGSNSNPGSANINVTLPSSLPGGSDGGSTGGATGGTSSGSSL